MVLLKSLLGLDLVNKGKLKQLCYLGRIEWLGITEGEEFGVP